MPSFPWSITLVKKIAMQTDTSHAILILFSFGPKFGTITRFSAHWSARYHSALIFGLTLRYTKCRVAKFKPWLKVKLTLKPFYSDKKSQHRWLRQEHWFELRTQPPPPQNHREQFFYFRTRGEMQFLVSTEFWIKSAQSSLHRIIRNKNSPLPPLYKILAGMTIISKTHFPISF